MPKHSALVAVRRSEARNDGGGGQIVNERKVCAYPQRAVYTGPARMQNDPTYWVHGNFVCR